MSPEEGKYIGMINLGALFFVFLNIPFILYSHYKSWTFLFLELCIFEGLLLFPFLFNKLRFHTLALIWFGGLLNAHLVVTSVVLGWEVEVHYLIFFTAGGAVMLFRRNQSFLMIASIFATIMTYYGAFSIARHVQPFYLLSGNEKNLLNTAIEATFLILLVSNTFIARYGSIEAENRLKEEKVKSDKLLEQLQTLDHQKTVFFQNISHELRTPLTLIIGPIENSLSGKMGKLNKSLEKHMRIALRNARILLRSINQLLDLSKLDAGRMELKARRKDLKKFVKYIIESFQPQAEKHQIKINVLSCDDSLELYFDPKMLDKVIFNLMSNALKFTPEGGQIFVSISISKDGRWVEISIKDTGVGIPEKDLPNIFDRFQQVDGTTTREQEGTGIGLCLVKEFVELHGGTVSVSSIPNLGTEFVVSLPTGRLHLGKHCIQERLDDFGPRSEFSILEQARMEAEKSVSVDKNAFDTSKESTTVLIIEDNMDMRTFIKEGINDHYGIIEAENGEEGLKIAKEVVPDLIISDVMMPKMDGYQLCRAINKNTQLSHIPVILLTARASDEMAVEGLESGAYDYLTKPFSPDVLIAKIKGILLRQAEQNELSRTDGLTGLRNRKAWEEEVRRELEKILRFGGRAGLAFLDLDNFKNINDTYGHHMGDQVLIHISSLLVSCLRSSDLVGRYGGDEFVIYFPETTSASAADSIERILAHVQDKPFGNSALRYSFCAGITEISPEKRLTLHEYILRADSAMYEAKKRGKDCVVLWEDPFGKKAVDIP